MTERMQVQMCNDKDASCRHLLLLSSFELAKVVVLRLVLRCRRQRRRIECGMNKRCVGAVASEKDISCYLTVVVTLFARNTGRSE